MIMSGQKKKYDQYIESLCTMREPTVPKARIDMRGAIQYAAKKGVSVENLNKKEKNLFIQYI